MSKAIFGLFDNQKELEAAAERLQKQGIEEIQIVDQERLGHDIYSIPNAAVGPASVGSGAGHGLPAFVSPVSGRASTSSISSYLKKFDIAEAEARFFAEALKRGGSLIIVDLEDEEYSEEVQQIMRQANAARIS